MSRFRLYRSSLHRAWITAGPPSSWSAVGGGLGAVAMVVGAAVAASSTGRGSIPPDTWLLVFPLPVIGLLSAGLADRAGWRIRAAIADYGTLAVARWPDRPRTADDARAWLASTSGRDATPVRRAAVHLDLDDREAAERDLATLAKGSPVDRAFAAHVLATIERERTGVLDLRPARDLANDLEPAERHFRLLALAWAGAIDDIERGRPWRSAFLEAIVGLDPFPVSRRTQLRIAIAQLRYGIVLAAFVVPLAWAAGNAFST